MNKFGRKLLVGMLAGTLVIGSVGTAYAASSPSSSQTYPSYNTGVVADTTKKTDDTKKEDTKKEDTKTDTSTETTTTSNVTPVVDTKADGTAKITEIKETNKKTIKIADSVSVNGVEYKVTTIGANTFADCAKAKTISLPATITKIDSKAFTGASSLKTIKISSSTLTVSKTAFKGVNTKKITIKLTADATKAEKKAIRKALRAAGFKGKIKG